MTVSMIEIKLVAISDANARMKESDFFLSGADSAMAPSSKLDKEMIVVLVGSLRGILSPIFSNFAMCSVIVEGLKTFPEALLFKSSDANRQEILILSLFSSIFLVSNRLGLVPRVPILH